MLTHGAAHHCPRTEPPSLPARIGSRGCRCCGALGGESGLRSGDAQPPGALISALHSFISAQDGHADCSTIKQALWRGVVLLSLVIAFRGYCNTLQGEMAVIKGNSGL